MKSRILEKQESQTFVIDRVALWSEEIETMKNLIMDYLN